MRLACDHTHCSVSGLAALRVVGRATCTLGSGLILVVKRTACGRLMLASFVTTLANFIHCTRVQTSCRQRLEPRNLRFELFSRSSVRLKSISCHYLRILLLRLSGLRIYTCALDGEVVGRTLELLHAALLVCEVDSAVLVICGNLIWSLRILVIC